MSTCTNASTLPLRPYVGDQMSSLTSCRAIRTSWKVILSRLQMLVRIPSGYQAGPAHGEHWSKRSSLTFTAAPMNCFANCSSPPAQASISRFAASIPTPSLTSSPSPMGDLTTSLIFSLIHFLSHIPNAIHHCITWWRKFPHTMGPP